MNLCVIVVTNDLKKIIKPPKYQPKICYKLGEKTILELCLEQIIQLNPKRIILFVSKNEIQQINRALKYLSYAKLISYCIFDLNVDNNRKLSLAHTCYSDYNVLVVPGNSPFLSSYGLQKTIAQRKSFFIHRDLFYLTKDCLNDIDSPEKVPNSLFQFSEKELIRIETQEQYEKALIEHKKQNSFTGKLWKKMKKK